MARILVIEDDEYLRTAVRDILSDAGHFVFVAKNGREGLSRYREQWPDLVITDIFMPELNGLEVIRELAATGVSIVAMSAGGPLDRRNPLEDATRLGASGVLVKPFTLESLMAAVNGALASLRPKLSRSTPAA